MNLTSEDIFQFWKERMAKSKGKTWNGDDPKPAFDYAAIMNHSESDFEIGDLPFDENNWRDPIIKPVQEFIHDILGQEYDKYGYDYIELKDQPFHTKLTPKDPKLNPWLLYIGRMDDQSIICFYDTTYHRAFQVQQYKRRGRIESFHDFYEKDYKIELETFTEIYKTILNIKNKYKEG